MAPLLLLRTKKYLHTEKPLLPVNTVVRLPFLTKNSDFNGFSFSWIFVLKNVISPHQRQIKRVFQYGIALALSVEAIPHCLPRFYNRWPSEITFFRQKIRSRKSRIYFIFEQKIVISQLYEHGNRLFSCGNAIHLLSQANPHRKSSYTRR